MRIIVSGLIAQHPLLGGITWHYLQFPVGLSRLGHDVYYIEDSGEWPYNLDGGPRGDDWIARDPSDNVDHIMRVMARFGLEGKWSYRFPTEPSPRWYGMSDFERQEILRSADLFINVSGTLEHPDRYRAVPRMVYIDTDPVFTQIKIALPQPDFPERVAAHDVHFTFGETLLKGAIPNEFDWIATRQPIVLSEWQATLHPREVFSTVLSWTSYKPLLFQGNTYAQKDVELIRYLDLPHKASDTQLEVALGGTHHIDWETQFEKLPPAATRFFSDEKRRTPAELLTHMGWRVVDAMQVCEGLDAYRNYVQNSKGECSVAKSAYVREHSGWFSDRSACYLAAGRPVVLQDTGFSEVLPTGEGLFAFETVEEAAAHMRTIQLDYKRHSAAARGIAEEFFDSAKVLSQLLDDALA